MLVGFSTLEKGSKILHKLFYEGNVKFGLKIGLGKEAWLGPFNNKRPVFTEAENYECMLIYS